MLSSASSYAFAAVHLFDFVAGLATFFWITFASSDRTTGSSTLDLFVPLECLYVSLPASAIIVGFLFATFRPFPSFFVVTGPKAFDVLLITFVLFTLGSVVVVEGLRLASVLVTAGRIS